MKGRWMIIFLIFIIFVISSCSKGEEREGNVYGVPETVITSAPQKKTYLRHAVFTFKSDMSEVYFQCNLDGGGWSDCASPVTYDAVGVGHHRFMVRAINVADMPDPEPAVYEWDVVKYGSGKLLKEEFAGYVSGEVFDLSKIIKLGDGESYLCSIDSGEWKKCDSKIDISDLENGKHNIRIVKGVRDSSGGVVFESGVTEVNFIIDTTPPDTILLSGPGGFSGNSVSFDFTSTEKNSTFICKLDDRKWTGCSSPYSLSGLSEGMHQISIAAIDPAGNIDPTPVVVSWIVDITPPVVTIISHPAPEELEPYAQFEFTSSEPGEIYCRIDGSGWEICNSPFESSFLLNGTHTFEIYAVDLAGNSGKIVSYSWMVDVEPPNVTITKKPPLFSNSTSATFILSSTKSKVTFKCKLDNKRWKLCSGGSKYSGLSEGSHTFQATAIDEYGYEDPTPAEYTWTVDTTPPDTSITGKPRNPSNSTSATFTFQSNEPGTFQCSLDGGAWESCSSPKSYASLPEGYHTFEVRARDLAGNESSAVSYTWDIDTTPPLLSITSTPHDPTDFKSAHFEFTSNERVRYFQCKLDNGNWTDCSGGTEDYSGLSSNYHTFYLRSQDIAGNVSEVQYSWRVFSWIYVSAGGYTTCAIRDDNSLWCWGSNNYGQLGIGANGGYKNIPQKVKWSWKQVSVGGWLLLTHVCAVSTSNSLDCWGYNNYGELGVGDTDNRNSPTWVKGGAEFVSAGAFHTCGLIKSLSEDQYYLYCWGYNNHGQVGDGTTTQRNSPVSIADPDGGKWYRVSTGAYHTCAIDANNYTLYCWGFNDDGELGIGNTTEKHSPTKVNNWVWADINLGAYHSCGIVFGLIAIPLYCWGYNYYGQLGIGNNTDKSTPTKILGDSRAVLVTAGSYHTCKLDGNALSCFGHGANGRLGDGDTDDHNTQVPIDGNWEKISAGFSSTCGIKNDGTLWCWGFNGYGQLGDGTTIDRYIPTHVYPTPWP